MTDKKGKEKNPSLFLGHFLLLLRLLFMTTNPQTNQTDAKVRIFELTDQQDSTYKLEGTEGSASVFLRAPGKRVIPSTSIWVDPKTGAYVRIRYIAGCNILEVEKQEERKFKPNVTTGADTIEFLNGKLVVVETGDGKTLCEFLDRCSFNEGNPNRRPEATIIFRELKKEVEAQAAINDFFNQKKVFDAIGKLAIQEGGKTRYKTESIDYLCSLFGIAGIEADNYNEKLQALIEFGRVNPSRFLESIADEQASMKVLVLTAIESGVANFVGDKFTLTDGGRVIKIAKSKKQEDKVQEVTDHLMTTEAFNDYQQLVLAVKHKNEKFAIGADVPTTTEFVQID